MIGLMPFPFGSAFIALLLAFAAASVPAAAESRGAERNAARSGYSRNR